MKATSWVKTKAGTWGIKVEGHASVGEPVELFKKKDNSRTIVNVETIVWAGIKDGRPMSLVTIAGKPNPTPPAPVSLRRCVVCGAPVPASHGFQSRCEIHQ